MQVNKNTSEKLKTRIPRKKERFEPYPKQEESSSTMSKTKSKQKLKEKPKPKPKAKAKSKKGKEKDETELTERIERLTIEEPTFSRAHARLIEPTLGEMKLVVPESHRVIEYMTPSEKMIDELFDQNQSPSTSQMDIDEIKQAIEPTQMEHINKISELLKREPKLKNEIKNIIVNQFVKAKIKPEQYEAIKQNIDALEVPEATHKAKKAKPRGKNSKLDNNVNKVL